MLVKNIKQQQYHNILQSIPHKFTYIIGGYCRSAVFLFKTVWIAQFKAQDQLRTLITLLRLELSF